MEPQSQTDMIDLPLHVISTIPCDVFFGTQFRHSFISFVTPRNEPRITAIAFSINGTVYQKSCFLIPLTDRLDIHYAYPQMNVYDGQRKFFFRFESINALDNCTTLIYSRIRESMRNKLSYLNIYSAFFPTTVAQQYVQKLPAPDSSIVIQSTFRVAQGSVFQNPTAVAMLMQSEKLIRTFTDLTIWVSTWNIGEKDPPDNLRELFCGPDKSYDVYVFGCQEIDMGAECILRGATPRKAKWDAAFNAAISQSESYTMISSYQLGTCYVSAFIRSKFSARVSEIANSEIVLGTMGFFNKTAISIRFQVDDTHICFICAHLSHGNKNFERRNGEVALIQAEMVFQTSHGPAHISDHDAVFWLGDFNYRLTIPDPQSRRRASDLQYLLEHDQLLLAYSKKKVFVGYVENPITFAFTYKYDKNSMRIDSSSKQRGPAWCDRIFYRAPPSLLHCREYNANHAMQMSDHHPVYGLFMMHPWVTDQKKAIHLYQDIEEKVRLLQWSCQISPDTLNFGTIKFGEQKTLSIIIRNDGQVPVLFAVKTPPPWVRVEPAHETLQVGQTMEVFISILIDHTSQQLESITMSKLFTAIEIHFPNDRAPTIVTLRAEYEVSPVGMPYEFLSRLQRKIYEVPSVFLEPLIPGDIDSAPIMKVTQFVDVPSELWQLVNEIIEIGDDPALFFKGGTYSEIMQIFEYMRLRRRFNHRFTQYSIAEALLYFISSFARPVIPLSAARKWAAEPSALMDICVQLAADNVRVLDYLMCFLQYLSKYIIPDNNQRGQLYRRWAHALLGGRNASDSDNVHIVADMIAALVALWDKNVRRDSISM